MGVLGPTDFLRSQCCLLLRLMFLYTCSVFSRLLVLLRRSRTLSIASAGLMILMVSTLLPIIHFPRRSWSPLREGYYTLLPKSFPGHYTRNFTNVFSESRWIFGGHEIHGHGVTGLCGVLIRFDELANLKLKDLALHDTHFKLFIESSKTGQFREGAIVPIVKSGTGLCP